MNFIVLPNLDGVVTVFVEEEKVIVEVQRDILNFLNCAFNGLPRAVIDTHVL